MHQSLLFSFASRRASNWRASLNRLRTAAAALAGLSTLVVGAAFAPRAGAADLYWDPNGATTGIGGTGTWDTTSLFWSTNPTGNIATTAYDNTAPSTVTAHFGGTAGTVTIATGTTINVNIISLETAGYTLAGTDATSILNLSGTAPAITNNIGNETISANITGTAGVAFGAPARRI